jgi:hypothetical protein
MTALRRRPLPVVKGNAKASDVANGHAYGSVKCATPSGYSYVLQIIVLASLAFSALLLYYPMSPKSLSTSYALCSRDGLHIYTVDDENTRVQCLVVHKAHVVDTGSLGKDLITPSFLDLILRAEEVQRRWRSSPFIVQDASTFEDTSRSELPIHFLNRGAIVVPGLSG